MWRKPNDAGVPPAPSSPITTNPSQTGLSSTPVAERSQASASAPSLVSSGNTTRITQGITLKGEVSGLADLYIDGEVEGNVHLQDSSVTVGPNGRVSAQIQAREISVQGAVRGDLHGGERVILGRSSRVTGNIDTGRVTIEEGARFEGKINMGPEDGRSKRASKRSSEAADYSAV